MLWSVVGLALAIAMAPLYVSLCISLSRLTARGAHRLVATRLGAAELDRLHAEGVRATSREFAVAGLPSGRGALRVRALPSSRLRQADLEITWEENGHPSRAAWSTVVLTPETRRH
jgi:hypothetical protein